MPPSPIVYCETNWIVALAFAHHQHHRLALDLRERAARAECEIRLPYAALLEAPHAITEESKRLNKAFTLLRDEIANAVQNLQPAFEPIATSLGSDVMDRYLALPALAIVAELEKSALVEKLRDQEPALQRMDEVRGSVNFRGKDAVDLYLLAAVIGDRMARGEEERPAIFFSTNKKEFQPKPESQAKMPERFYGPYRLIWREDFDLEPAVRHWRNEYP